MGSPGTMAPSGMCTCQSVVLPMGCSVGVCSTVISCRENLCLDTWNISSSDSGVCRAAFHPLPSLLTDCAAFCPFSPGLFLSGCCCGCRAQLCLVANLVGWAGSGCVQHGADPTTPHQGHSAAPHQHPVHCFNHNFSAAQDGDKSRPCLQGKTGETNHFPYKTHWKNWDNATRRVTMVSHEAGTLHSEWIQSGSCCTKLGLVHFSLLADCKHRCEISRCAGKLFS